MLAAQGYKLKTCKISDDECNCHDTIRHAQNPIEEHAEYRGTSLVAHSGQSSSADAMAGTFSGGSTGYFREKQASQSSSASSP